MQQLVRLPQDGLEIIDLWQKELAQLPKKNKKTQSWLNMYIYIAELNGDLRKPVLLLTHGAHVMCRLSPCLGHRSRWFHAVRNRGRVRPT
jgi:hypothetical protein